MGTNYYYYQKPRCEKCGSSQEEPIHIGKSSMGWCFSLHISPENGINNLADWISLFNKGGIIEDEYKKKITSDEILSIIKDRSGKNEFDKPFKRMPFMPYDTWEEFHALNDSKAGPNGLLRHRIGVLCVGNGDGTWDLMKGEFS